MTTLRYFTDSIDELEKTEHDLEENGVPRSHIHLLSRSESELIQKDLPVYSDFSKRDILHGGVMGALLGVTMAIGLLLASFLYGVTDSSIWVVIAFVSAMIIGFCTWEGGLFGLTKVNHKLAAYQAEVNSGRHLLVIDAKDASEEKTTRLIVNAHPLVQPADEKLSA